METSPLSPLPESAPPLFSARFGTPRPIPLTRLIKSATRPAHPRKISNSLQRPESWHVKMPSLEKPTAPSTPKCDDLCFRKRPNLPTPQTQRKRTRPPVRAAVTLKTGVVPEITAATPPETPGRATPTTTTTSDSSRTDNGTTTRTTGSTIVPGSEIVELSRKAPVAYDILIWNYEASEFATDIFDNLISPALALCFTNEILNNTKLASFGFALTYLITSSSELKSLSHSVLDRLFKKLYLNKFNSLIPASVTSSFSPIQLHSFVIESCLSIGFS